jgi:hypothetical protein
VAIIVPPLASAAQGLPLGIAALVTWLIAGTAGLFMLGRWLARGGLAEQRQTGAGPTPAVIFGHFGMGLTGLLLWVSYLITGLDALAWAAVAVLMLVIGLGLSTVTLWTPYPGPAGGARHAARSARAPRSAGGVDGAGGMGTAGGVDTAGVDGVAAAGGMEAAGGAGIAGGMEVAAGLEPLTDEMFSRALADDELARRLTEQAIAGAYAQPQPERYRRPAPRLAALIPVGHGIAAVATFLLTVLAAISAR